MQRKATEILTVKDLAIYLHCHQATIYRLAKRGEIPSFRVGGVWRFRYADIANWSKAMSNNVRWR
jgi:excisionase family DNA binding protein